VNWQCASRILIQKMQSLLLNPVEGSQVPEVGYIALAEERSPNRRHRSAIPV